jgi:hypothetical protein
VELYFSHGPLEPQEHPVVDIAWIVDAAGVDQQSAGDLGELHQPGDVGVAAGQPGDLDPEDRTHVAAADPRHQVGESFPGDAEPARDTRSVSITCTSLAGQPSRTASSARPYWRSVDSVCSRTCTIDDWRR